MTRKVRTLIALQTLARKRRDHIAELWLEDRLWIAMAEVQRCRPADYPPYV